MANWLREIQKGWEGTLGISNSGELLVPPRPKGKGKLWLQNSERAVAGASVQERSLTASPGICGQMVGGNQCPTVFIPLHPADASHWPTQTPESQGTWLTLSTEVTLVGAQTMWSWVGGG